MAGNNVNYFEPNDYDFNVEDLCVGVKLEVSVPGRPISASAGDNNISWQTILDDVNLFGGTDGYLSTSYSDISSLDAHNGGNKDSFGIEYINIHYNSWNFPEVDMKLIDVRGNAVMNPLESRRDDNDKTGSFLNALFTFPYPMFRLTVKGYYGRPVTYKLTVRDVRTNFNASNGNFEVTVKFIGYMFGYLNDIPMQYLLIAPDINYDGKPHLLGNFSDGNGHAIPTFRNFLKGVTDAIKMSSEDSEIGQLKIMAKEIEGALNIFYDIKKLVEKVGIDLSRGTYYSVCDITKRGDTEFVLSFKDKYENGEKISDEDIRIAIDGLKKDIQNIIDNHQKYFDDYDVKDTYRLSEISNLKEKNNDLLSNSTFTDPLKVYFNYEELKSQVGSMINKLLIEKNENDEHLKSLMEKSYKEAIGWKPTIGNIFEMVFAHFKCFYENYYTCIENIKGTSSQRNLSDLSVNTDCKSIGNANQTVPPYPLITNTNGKYEWVGSVIEMKERYEENYFVESIVKGATDTGEELAKIAMEYDLQREFSSFPRNGIPTLLSDIYNGGNGNPYVGTSYNMIDDSIPTAMKTFAKRLWLRYIFNGGETCSLSLDSFAKLEALNCFREHLDISGYSRIKEFTCWGPLECDEAVKNYIKEFTVEGHYPSLLYSDYAKSDKTEGCPSGLLLKNCFFKEGSDGILDYDKLMVPVYEYLNMYYGDLRTAYEKVFPLTKYPLRNEIFDNLFGKTITGDRNYIDCFWEYEGQYVGKGSGKDLYLSDHEDVLYALSTEGIDDVKVDIIHLLNRLKTTPDENTKQKFILQALGFIDSNSNITEKCKKAFYSIGVGKIPYSFLFLTYHANNNGYIDENHLLYPILREYGEELETIVPPYIDSLVSFFKEMYNSNTKGKNPGLVYTGVLIAHEFTIEQKERLMELLNKSETVFHLRGIDNGWSDSDVDRCVSAAGQIFARTLNEMYEKMSTTQNRIITQKQSYVSTDKKIAIYMTMKELYDRWKFGTWRPNTNETTYGQNLMVGVDNFVFLDSQYDDIEQKHCVNFDVFADLVRNIVDTAKEMSVYSFLYEICKAANMTLHALPINVYDYLGGNGNENKIQEMFTAYPYMACENDNAMQTTYVAMYAHKPSEHLNIVDSYNSYADDGIDFTSNATVINSNNPLPVFGVTYGMQKQRFFKNISVGSDNPKTTAHSLMSELLISKQATSGSQNIGFEGHDIFDVYASKSYTCKVEMMGNAMIMPMMYFQLNNIPLFKGGYFIINAEHNISRNGMTTTFTGVRVNKNRFDLLPKTDLNLQTYLENVDGSEGGSGLFDRDNKTGGVEEKSVGIKSEIELTFYNHYDTIIILDAGHEMTRSGKESPKFDVFLLNNTDEQPVITTGDTTEKDSILRPLSIEGKEEYQAKGGIKNQGRTRYREYWGNRKIVDEIKRQLILKGVPEEHIIIQSTTGRNAPSYESLHGNTYSSKVNEIYKNNDGNCIMVSVHSNAITGITESNFFTNNAKYWSIFSQNNNENILTKGRRKNFKDGGLPHTEISRVLADCIRQGMVDVVKSREWKNNGFNMFIGEKNINKEIFVFEETKGGIRPLTYCKPPTVLSENFFHTNGNTVRILGTKKGIELIAKAHVDGIMKFFEHGDSIYNGALLRINEALGKVVKVGNQYIATDAYEKIQNGRARFEFAEWYTPPPTNFGVLSNN